MPLETCQQLVKEVRRQLRDHARVVYEREEPRGHGDEGERATRKEQSVWPKP